MDMIDVNYNPTAWVPTMPQLEGPWAIARGTDLPIPSKWKAGIILASAGISAFHGTRRNGGSIFWGAVWFVLGAVFPVVTPVVAVAQDIGKCKNNCRYQPTVNLSGSRKRRR